MNLHQTISDAFVAQVHKNRDRVAVETKSERISYVDLNAVANRIANVLIDRSGPGAEPVILLFNQGTTNVAATLAVIKAGKIYVPIDPEASVHHLRNIASDCGASAVICSNATAQVASALLSSGMTIVKVDEIQKSYCDDEPGVTRDPSSPVYIFYTSGSTGPPKGVVDCHRNVLHNIMRYTTTLNITRNDRLSMVQSPDFSGTVSSMFAALLNGATLLPYDLHEHGLNSLDAWILRQNVTIFHSVPSIFRHLRMPAGSYPNLRIIRLEGDKANPGDIELYRERFDNSCRLVNGLGATECGIVRQYFVDHGTQIEFDTVPIGYPVVDMDVRIADDAGVDVVRGEVGEIVVRSRFLALGYWNQPDLTLTKFRPHPEDPYLRDYHSGDIGRMHADGCIEYVGRIDFQTKIRGQRVDTAAVEEALRNMEEIRDAAIQPWTDEHGESRLIAYLVPQLSKLPGIGEFRSRLARNFAAHQLPTFFMILDDIPFTSNGKLDRRMLSEPRRERLNLMSPYVPPLSDREKELSVIWKQAFSLDAIGVLDNFFDLGGDSLTVATVVWLAEEAALNLSAQQLQEHPTIRELARSQAIVRRAAQMNGDPSAEVPLTPFQTRFFQRNSVDPNHWNISVQFTSAMTIEPDLLKQALAVVIAAHDALRIRFQKSATSWRQIVLPATAEVIDAETDNAIAYFYIEGNRSANAEDIIREKSWELHESLDLNDGPVLRLAYFKIAGSETDHMILLAHHLVMDALSLNTVLRDLRHAYAKLKNGDVITSFDRDYSFQMFCNRLRTLANTQSTISAAEQWSKMCWQDVTDLPRDYPPTTNENCNAAARAISLECDVNGALLMAHKAGYATHELLITALYNSISIWAGSNAVLIDILKHGRELLPDTADASGAVGTFLYNVPIVLKASGPDSLQKLNSITDQLKIYWSDGWAFETVRYMTENQATKDMLKSYPQSNILFNYQGQAARISNCDLFRVSDVEQVGTHSPRGRRDHALAVKASLSENQLDVRFVYSGKIHRRQTIRKLATDFQAQLFNLLELCRCCR